MQGRPFFNVAALVPSKGQSTSAHTRNWTGNSAWFSTHAINFPLQPTQLYIFKSGSLPFLWRIFNILTYFMKYIQWIFILFSFFFSTIVGPLYVKVIYMFPLFLVNSNLCSHPMRGKWQTWNNSPFSCSRSAASPAKILLRSKPSQDQVKKKEEPMTHWPFTRHFSVLLHLINICPCSMFKD